MEYATPKDLNSHTAQRVALVGRFMVRREKAGYTFLALQDCADRNVFIQAIRAGKFGHKGLRRGSVVVLVGNVEAEQRSPQGVNLMVESIEVLHRVSVLEAMWAAACKLARDLYRAIPPNLTQFVRVR